MSTDPGIYPKFNIDDLALVTDENIDIYDHLVRITYVHAGGYYFYYEVVLVSKNTDNLKFWVKELDLMRV